MPWIEAMEPEDVLTAAYACGVGITCDTGEDLSAALRWATTVADGGPMVIAGSLYLVSDVLLLLRDAEQRINQFLR
jgi:folylpolyglutamate synthase